MIKLAVAIFRLPSPNPYKASAIQIFNYHYLEFQYPAYLLCYFLHSYYQDKYLSNNIFLKKVILK